jgi:hypothetical protein
MEFFEQATAFFGYSPDAQELSIFLDEHNIRERPEYDPNDGTPMIWVEKKDEGYLLQFGMKSNFERKRTSTFGVGEMILEGVRFYGPLNSSGYATFKGKLPFGINFEQTVDELVGKFGAPDFESDAEDPTRVLQWNCINNFEFGGVLTPDFKRFCYVDISPAKKKFRR